MIIRFRHKGLEQFFRTGKKSGILPEHVKRLRLILIRLNTAKDPGDMDAPGLELHKLMGEFKGFWSVRVSGNWRVIFRFEQQNSTDIDYLDYH
ncbi:MAG: type II toxin-antitoxin system RelE/ParE family toxin [Nitrospirae bacterium]|nr:type II toxin-antitoxin system RelE/ParE family toxin [Nitrospirota bacterium]MBI3352893.1 type II toxin-antitoxin system RelE/ParE family toxin [Nitrospirota bacterium]